MLAITFVYAHNNRNDALRFKDIVHEILSGNKRYISGKINLITMSELDERHLTLFNPDEEGNQILLENQNSITVCRLNFIILIGNLTILLSHSSK